MSENKTVERKLQENLSGEALSNALDLVAYLKNMGMTADDGDRFYYKGEMMCIFVSFKNEEHPNGVLMIFDCPLSGHDGFPIDETVQEFTQAHVNNCGGCGGDCGHKERAATKAIFGKECENLCSSEVCFFNPDTEAVAKIKILMDLWKFKIDNVVGYSSQDR